MPAADPMRSDLHEGPVLARGADFAVVDCRACGYAHVAPMPTVDELAHAYRHEYYVTDKPLYLARYEEDRDWWLDVYGDRLAIMESLLAPGARAVVDVGCGPGLFLDAAATRGWQTLGIEPSRQAAAHARKLGHDIREGLFDAAMAARLDPVDAVHMALVLEHVPAPADLLAAARTMLRPSGVICVVVPNDFNPLQRAAQGQGLAPWWIAPPHHLNYFTHESLGRLLRRTGFAVIRQTATFPMELFLLMGEIYIGDDALGRACHAKRKAFEGAMRAAGQGERLAAFYECLAAQGLGREVVLFARREPD